jgi:hypothetical protein
MDKMPGGTPGKSYVFLQKYPFQKRNGFGFLFLPVFAFHKKKKKGTVSRSLKIMLMVFPCGLISPAGYLLLPQ